MVVLRDPKHIKVVTEASKLSEQSSIVRREYEGVFDVPNRHANTDTQVFTPEEYNKKANHALTAPIQKHVTGASLAELGELYASKLSNNMDDKMFQVGTWTQIEDFWSFFQQVFTRCLVETLFGSAIFRQYPKFVKEYWKFEDALDTYVPGMSWLLGSSAYEEPRNALLQGIEKWLRTSHVGSGFAKIGIDDPSWDELRGSKFIQEIDSLLAEFSSEESRAVELLKFIHWCVYVDEPSK